MERGAELLKIYDEAIALSEGQSRAIEQENWILLTTLLDARERCIQRAEQILAQPMESEHKAVLTERLRRLHQIDDQNQQLLAKKHASLQTEMQTLGRSKSALSGYLDSFGGSLDPNFVDQDR